MAVAVTERLRSKLHDAESLPLVQSSSPFIDAAKPFASATEVQWRSPSSVPVGPAHAANDVVRSNAARSSEPLPVYEPLTDAVPPSVQGPLKLSDRSSDAVRAVWRAWVTALACALD